MMIPHIWAALHRNLRNTEKQTKFNYYSSFVVIPGTGVGALIPTTPTAEAAAAFLGSRTPRIWEPDCGTASGFCGVIEAGAFSDCDTLRWDAVKMFPPHCRPAGWWGISLSSYKSFRYFSSRFSRNAVWVSRTKSRTMTAILATRKNIYIWNLAQLSTQSLGNMSAGFFFPSSNRQIQLLEPISGALFTPGFTLFFHMYSIRSLQIGDVYLLCLTLTRYGLFS